MALTDDLEAQAVIEVLATRIAKVFLYNQLVEAWKQTCQTQDEHLKILAEVYKLRSELWP